MNTTEVKMVTCEIEGHNVEIQIYPELAEAKEWNWNSLAFPGNNATFLSATIGREWSFYLTTEGEVRIEVPSEQTVYGNQDEDEIRRLLSQKALEDEENYQLEDNNWFSFEVIRLEDEGPCVPGVWVTDEVLDFYPDDIEEDVLQTFKKCIETFLQELATK